VKGALTSDHTAYVSLVIVEAGGEYELIVDTGFSGSLYLPEDAIAAWGLPFVSSVPIALADQSTVIVDVYEARVIWFGTTIPSLRDSQTELGPLPFYRHPIPTGFEDRPPEWS
jgi:predicted aspartyl protease